VTGAPLPEVFQKLAGSERRENLCQRKVNHGAET
jgi:hypothetical protein